MESLTATWRFARPRTADRAERGPLVLDTLHALQCWRVGHPGRMFRFVRPSPFACTEGLAARLLSLAPDELAYGELDRWCHEHQVQVVAAKRQQAGAGEAQEPAPAAG
jgi:hypothetical protein